jgi:16S rRNA (uracil1498-N3)-methyltransferase
MSLPRLAAAVPEPREGLTVPIGAEQAQHLRALRLKPGEALELLLAHGPWRAELAALDRGAAVVRLVAPISEDREPPVGITVYLPVTAQLALVDEMIPPLVELGATRLVPTIWARSENDARKTLARMERWRRILTGAAEQSHRSVIPPLEDPAPFDALIQDGTPQRWLAYEVAADGPNPRLRAEPIALASGPEGGITDEEFERLRAAGWQSASLGRSILRAVTAPVALLGAVRFGLGTRP